MVIKDRILGKAWEAQFTMLAKRKKCWVGSMKKWLFKNQPQEVVGFFPLIQLARALQVGIAQLPLRTVLGTTHVHLTHDALPSSLID
jgi:hypothetical protein